MTPVLSSVYRNTWGDHDMAPIVSFLGNTTSGVPKTQTHYGQQAYNTTNARTGKDTGTTKLNEEKANDLKCKTEAVQEGLHEEAFQQRERKRRANNIVIHGLKENTSTGDAIMIQNLIDTIEVTHIPKYFTRLGKTSTSTFAHSK